MKFTVVSACDEGYAELQEITKTTLESYCKIRGYNLKIGRILEKERPPAWYKIKEILRELDTNADFVLWIDTDAIVVNHDFRLEDIIKEDKDIYFSCNWAALNSGVIMFRNNDFNRYFLELVWDQTDFINHDWWEQKAIIHLLENRVYPIDKICEIPSNIFNSEAYYKGCFVFHMMQSSKRERIKKFSKILQKQL